MDQHLVNLLAKYCDSISRGVADSTFLWPTLPPPIPSKNRGVKLKKCYSNGFLGVGKSTSQSGNTIGSSVLEQLTLVADEQTHTETNHANAGFLLRKYHNCTESPLPLLSSFSFSSSYQGRLNEWAHWARAPGPRIFFFLFEGPPTGCGEINFLNWLSYCWCYCMIVQTLAVHIWSTCTLLYMVTVQGVSYLV